MQENACKGADQPIAPLAETETITEFPRELLSVLRCSYDRGPLKLIDESSSGPIGVIEGSLQCATCLGTYRIEKGIARLMVEELSREDRHEMHHRDRDFERLHAGPFVPPDSGWRSKVSDRLEIPPHLASLSPLPGCLVLEMGCGDGRYTLLLAQSGARVVAVDFSFNSLRQLSVWLCRGEAPTAFKLTSVAPGDLRTRVALVQADASHFSVAERSFDRALSATPLDSRDQRMAMYRTVTSALKDDGWFLCGVEYDDLSRRLLGLPVARRYTRGGIFIEHFDVPTLRSELAPYFRYLRFRVIRPRIPFSMHLPERWRVLTGRMIARLPLLRQLGEILIVRAANPTRPPTEGVSRRGLLPAKLLYRWYLRRKGLEPLWENNELV